MTFALGKKVLRHLFFSPFLLLPFLFSHRKKVKFFLGSIKKLKILKVGFKDYVSVSFEGMENSQLISPQLSSTGEHSMRDN